LSQTNESFASTQNKGLAISTSFLVLPHTSGWRSAYSASALR